MQGATRYALRDAYHISEREAEFYIRVFRQQYPIKQQRAIIIADFHFPYHVQQVFETILAYLEKVKPDIIILLGDVFDFYQISHWRKDPTRPRFLREREVCRKLFAELSSACHEASQKILIGGNHEARLAHHLMEKDPEFYDLPELALTEQYHLADLGWQYISTEDYLASTGHPYCLWGIYCFHGDEDGSRGGKYVAANHYHRGYCNIITAHSHVSQEYVVRKTDGTYTRSYVVGCACDLSPSYSLLNKWNHGFLELLRHTDGHLEFHNRKIFEGRYIE